MSLIATPQNTLNNQSILLIRQPLGEVKVSSNGDFTTFSDEKGIFSINVRNSDSYFGTLPTVMSISKEIIEVLSKNNINVETKNMFVIGEVIERGPHPKSEKLFLLKINADQKYSIVTNSLNSTVGKKVVVAKVGAILPSGKNITHSKVMGVESEGMLCGGVTLGKEPTEGVLEITKQDAGQEFIL